MRAWMVISLLVWLQAGCGEVWNDPYPGEAPGLKTLYTVFEERPKHLDPARSYSSNEVEFTGQIYEPPLQYHFLKRPYTLEPLTTTGMPIVRYWDKTGRELSGNFMPEQVARTTYDITIRPGIRYQPHPAFAQDQLHRLTIQVIVAIAPQICRTGAALLIVATLQDLIYVVRRTLLLQETDHALDLLIADIGTVHAHNPPPARHVQHIAVAQ